ncbi:MAG: DUF2127 domain-containing protein [Methanomassiliicoccus sp.]|nr:MAG: DUF2127 domain-containing protein [Methanomassiliicoccus sp.]
MARLVIAILLSAERGPVLDNPVSDEVMMFINIMFFVLGILGLLTAFGLWTEKRWGYLGTIALSLVTIAFDVWAVLAVQSSAAFGIVFPVVFIVYLALIRHDLARGEGQ